MKKQFSTISLLLALLVSTQAHAKTKNIILMIGDGMGPQQVSQAIMYRQAMKSDKEKLSLEKLYEKSLHAVASTNSADSVVTDSAAAATALACGIKTNNDMVGKDINGKPCTSILRIAKQMGKSTGLVSTTRITHATPASFASANVSRENENEIAKQYVNEAAVDIFLGGGARQFLPQGESFSGIPECKSEKRNPLLEGKSKRKDYLSLLSQAKDNGYTFVCTKHQLNALPLGSKILGTFANTHLPLIQERQQIAALPSLTEMTEVALKHLSQNENGFFIMIEGGEIDFAGHRNDAATQLKETLDFDKAIAVAMKFADEHPDTLLLVTADHETGGFSMSYQHHKHAAKPVRLASNEMYEARYNNPTQHIFRLFEQQTGSFDTILNPSLELLSSTDKANASEWETHFKTAVHLLMKNIRANSAYTLSEEEAKDVLTISEAHEPMPGHYDPNPFSSSDEIEYVGNKLAHYISEQSFSVWATGNHTHIPVDVFAYGKTSDIKNNFPALMDNTDIFKMMKTAFGR
ncbi:MAG: hypothetical protein COX62_08780 [Deltaproteobacteria bacterium CG_4_10_14_0_2_um_filter_43_8]|nr:MAG: hypothetical protein COV43_02855 [Deltaproteobacteria bacterium CG11_big_fil_rev_8_21_14_0_20_42_23]PJA18373.1 MAG: hypothetical protein COX62_08780 [Deltaproteobacteria bacterium CG_4_10_14_0_2_um_filter_43_8]PJC63637.1 MAG: hypothetical protein CO021_08445 [Deltaproteobacteria bacterium CG_4_9_14_0_2_um_filter_42_21]